MNNSLLQKCFVFVLAVLISSVALTTAATDDHSKSNEPVICRALALGGGGDWGSFEAGELLLMCVRYTIYYITKKIRLININ